MRSHALGMALLTASWSASAQTTPLKLTLSPVPAVGCPALSPLLSDVAGDIASGGQAQAAVTRRAGLPERFRYWNVTPEQLEGTLRAACEGGFADYGVAPAGQRLIVFAALWGRREVAVAVSAPAAASAPLPVNALSSSPNILEWVNTVRVSGQTCGGVWKAPVPPLTTDPRLTAAAQGHASDMVRQGFADHTNPITGSTPQSRATAQGWEGKASENIRYGTPTVEGAMTWWLSSPVHCANIMNPYWTHVGAGQQVRTAQSHYWVLVFGHQP